MTSTQSSSASGPSRVRWERPVWHAAVDAVEAFEVGAAKAVGVGQPPLRRRAVDALDRHRLADPRLLRAVEEHVQRAIARRRGRTAAEDHAAALLGERPHLALELAAVGLVGQEVIGGEPGRRAPGAASEATLRESELIARPSLATSVPGSCGRPAGASSLPGERGRDDAAARAVKSRDGDDGHAGLRRIPPNRRATSAASATITITTAIGTAL